MRRFVQICKPLSLASVMGLYLSVSGPVSVAGEVPAKNQREQAQEPRILSIDVVLDQDGVLRGAAVKCDGKALSGAIVMLQQDNKLVTKVTTNEKGEFHFENIRTGVYVIKVISEDGETSTVVRAWAQGIAPPSATPVAVVALGESQPRDVVRGLIGGPGITPYDIAAMAFAFGLGAGLPIGHNIDHNHTPGSP